METRRWTNPSQPQTLQIAVILLYLRAVMGLLFGTSLFFFGPAIGLVGLVGMGAAGFGIANEKRWGYILGVVIAIVAISPVGILVLTGALSITRLFSLGVMLSVMFDVALIALLLHPMSREYQRIWFS